MGGEWQAGLGPSDMLDLNPEQCRAVFEIEPPIWTSGAFPKVWANVSLCPMGVWQQPNETKKYHWSIILYVDYFQVFQLENNMILVRVEVLYLK